MKAAVRWASCPCCEKLTRHPNHALCVECWRAAPANAKRAHQALFREYVAERASLKDLLASIERVAAASRVAQFGEPLQ
jgi:hypothetical protein